MAYDNKLIRYIINSLKFRPYRFMESGNWPLMLKFNVNLTEN